MKNVFLSAVRMAGLMGRDGENMLDSIDPGACNNVDLRVGGKGITRSGPHNPPQEYLPNTQLSTDKMGKHQK